MAYTAIIEKTEDGWYMAQCEQLPAAITQGQNLNEVKENLADAINLVLQVEKEDARKRFQGVRTFRRKILV